MSNKFYTDEEAQELQKLDVFTYLYNYEPSELVKSGKKEYRTATHSSLVISNGKWIWFSQGKGGVSAISYLMDVKGINYYEAVKYVDKCIRDSPPVYHVNKCSKTNDGIFKLPPVSKDNKKMMYYLKNKRKIDKEVIQFYYQKGMIYECNYDHSVVFVGYDEKGIERYASKRATDGDWKMDVFNSNKEYSFQLVNKESDVLNIFESAIDLMSFQTLEKLHKRNWKKNNYLSLSGVTAIGNSIEESELPIALGRFLEINPQIKVLNLYLDNDKAGKNSIAKINYLLGKSYQIYDKGPKKMKDVNEVLIRRFKKKEEYSR